VAGLFLQLVFGGSTQLSCAGANHVPPVKSCELVAWNGGTAMILHRLCWTIAWLQTDLMPDGAGL